MPLPQSNSSQQIYLAQPRGFCAGVERAITIVEEALKKYGSPIYVRHEIIHNAYVVKAFEAKGVVFINDLSEVPADSILIFSAHGVPKTVKNDAHFRKLTVFDATCPLVSKVHAEVIRLHASGYQIIMIGHHGHPEVEGTMGQIDDPVHLIEKAADVERLNFKEGALLAFVTQTTLSVDETSEIAAALLKKYPNIHSPKKQDICYATQNRQDAVKAMLPLVEIVVVVGSPNSSNSKRLQELSLRMHVPAFLVDDPLDIKSEWFSGVKNIGITAGASAPEELTAKVIQAIKALSNGVVLPMNGIDENINFSLPKGLV